MQKLYSELIGLPVFDEYSPSPLALIRDVLIDPETGKVLAFILNRGGIVVPLDVRMLTNGLYISDQNQIESVENVLRVKEVIGLQIGILGAKVITQRSKTHLGKVVDYEIDTTQMTLHALHSAKTFLFFRFNDRIIHFKNIVRIARHTVIVKDLKEIKAKEQSPLCSSAFAS